MPVHRQITQPLQLVVEGRDALAFFERMTRRLGLTTIQVQDFGGVSELPSFLLGLRGASAFARVTSLGIIRDAEMDAQGAFQSVQGALRRAGLAVPERVEHPAGAAPRVSVFIVPDATTAGSLETLCLGSVIGDPALPCVDAFFDCVHARLAEPPTLLVKARARVFLATRPRPHLALGQALEAGYWPWESPAFDRVKRFLIAL